MDFSTGLPAILLVALWAFVVYRGVVIFRDEPGRMTGWVLAMLSLPVMLAVLV